MTEQLKKLFEAVTNATIRDEFYISFDYCTRWENNLDFFIFHVDHGIKESVYLNDDESTPEIQLKQMYLLIEKYSK